MEDFIAALIALFLYILGFFTKPVIDMFIDWQNKKAVEKKTTQEESPRLIIPFPTTTMPPKPFLNIPEKTKEHTREMKTENPEEELNWCAKCRKKQPMKERQEAIINKTKCLRGRCGVCGTKIFRILGRTR